MAQSSDSDSSDRGSVRSSDAKSSKQPHHGTLSTSSTSSSWMWCGAVMLTVSVTVLVSAASYAYLRYQRNARLPKSSDNKKITENGHRSQRVVEGEHEEFAAVADRVRSLRNVPTKERLILYAFYKQATVGDAPTIYVAKSINGGFVASLQEHAKWDAWSRLRAMSQGRAVHMYVELANQLLQSTSSGPSSSAEASQDDEKSDADANEDDVEAEAAASSGAFGPPKVSQLVVLDEDDESENDDDDKLRKLLSAASTNDLHALKQLLGENPAMVDASDGSGQTALHMAADRGHAESVQLLLEQFHANVVAADHDGISVLQAAVIAGHVDVCRVLLTHGADPDQPDHDGDTPRTCADDDGSDEMQDLF